MNKLVVLAATLVVIAPLSAMKENNALGLYGKAQGGDQNAGKKFMELYEQTGATSATISAAMLLFLDNPQADAGPSDARNKALALARSKLKNPMPSNDFTLDNSTIANLVAARQEEILIDRELEPREVELNILRTVLASQKASFLERKRYRKRIFELLKEKKDLEDKRVGAQLKQKAYGQIFEDRKKLLTNIYQATAVICTTDVQEKLDQAQETFFDSYSALVLNHTTSYDDTTLKELQAAFDDAVGFALSQNSPHKDPATRIKEIEDEIQDAAIRKDVPRLHALLLERRDLEHAQDGGEVAFQTCKQRLRELVEQLRRNNS